MPDTTVTAQVCTNDYYYGSEWYLTASTGVNAVTAWNTTTGYSSIRIAVLDTGIANDHPDLQVTEGLNCTPNGTSSEWYPTETYANHGTTVAGVINAIGNNSIGIVGTAPNVTSLLKNARNPLNSIAKIRAILQSWSCAVKNSSRLKRFT
jgi:serine protease